MDFLSSDEEYFDAYSNFIESNVEKIILNKDEKGNVIHESETDILKSNFEITKSNIDKPEIEQNDVSSSLILNNSANNINEVNETSLKELTVNDIDKDSNLFETNTTFPALNKDNLTHDINDSSGSEDYLAELDNSGMDDENKNKDSNKFDSESVKPLEKSNAEIQLEERTKLESLMSIEELDDLRTKAIEMKDQGNSCFKLQTFSEAIEIYTNAIMTCPLKFTEDHAIFHSNRAATLAKLDKIDEAINDLDVSLGLKPDYLKALIRRAELKEKSDKFSEALDDYRLVLKLDPRNWAALHAEQTLPEKIRIQQEKMKNEMFAQLKQLGNLVLKPFGLSTDNFKMVQDPATGSYSVDFQQNK